MIEENDVVAVIGLGYVGLPLALEFSKKRPVIGFDINKKRVAELSSGNDSTQEISANALLNDNQLQLTSKPTDLSQAKVFIIAVPTPLDDAKRPDLKALKSATKTVANAMKSGAIVIFESTVYPGCTEEYCVPLLESVTGLKLNQDFYVGYSPERANPGDKVNTLTKIIKVTSGSTPEAAGAVDALYGSIIQAGTYQAQSIKVAEMAKIIENTQRDVNIALMNELAIICDRVGIDTLEVLEAASTKWNFLPFKPGLVGGHCIGVDPYYLTYCAERLNYHPDVILAGRRINDNISEYLVGRIIRLMLKKEISLLNSRILVMGLTFKENCPDMRNSKVIDMVRKFEDYMIKVDVYDPWVHPEDWPESYVRNCIKMPDTKIYDAVVLAVNHREFSEMGAEKIKGFGSEKSVFFDVKGAFDECLSDGRL